MTRDEMINQVIQSCVDYAPDKNNVHLSYMLKRDIDKWCKNNGYKQSRQTYGMGITIVMIHKIGKP